MSGRVVTYVKPTSMEELQALTTQNTQYEGFGTETTIVLPCAFCAAPGSARARITEVEKAMQRGGSCKECGRSWRAIFTLPGLSAKRFEIVQSAGDDPPGWMPKMRRAEPLPADSFSRPECCFAACPNPAACQADKACASPDPLHGVKL